MYVSISNKYTYKIRKKVFIYEVLFSRQRCLVTRYLKHIVFLIASAVIYLFYGIVLVSAHEYSKNCSNPHT